MDDKHFEKWRIAKDTTELYKLLSNERQQSSQGRYTVLHEVFNAAELYYKGQVEDAITICQRILVKNAKAQHGVAEAAALLGDIYVEQGLKHLALSLYKLAAFKQPNSALYRKKLHDLQDDLQDFL